MSVRYFFIALFFFNTALGLMSVAHASPKTTPAAEWDLTDLVKNEKQWTGQVEQIEKQIPTLGKCQGKLTTSAKQLATCLDLQYGLYRKTGRTCSWAFLKQSTNHLLSKNTAHAQRCQNLFAKIFEESSFFEPEIVQAGTTKIQGFVQNEKALEPYSQILRRTLDQGAHVLSSSEEALIGALSPSLSKSRETFSFLLNTEMPWSKVKMSDGVQEINVAGYTKYRGSSHRPDRQAAFQSFYSTLSQFERTMGSTYAQTVITRNTLARLKKHKNALSAALSPQQIPEATYRKMIQEVNKSLPTLHRYLQLRGKMLGLKKQEYFDAYPTVIKSPKTFPIAETQKMTLDAVKPLGTDYVTKITEATSKNWMSIYPSKGKSSGAFMSSNAYDVHPYVFLNHQDDYSSASTYAHEWGHALHSILSNAHQPYAKSRYSIFIGEIAAITNEVLLNDHAVKTAQSDEERLYYLNEALESLRTTYFRQAQFAEFELAVHEIAAKEGALTGQKISEVYGDILRRYYGHNKKVMNVDPLYFKEWMFVPHFYGGFYVYQYSTSMAGAYYFADQILAGNKDVLNKYLQVLKAGGSKYPHEILLDAGLDLSNSTPYKTLDKRANQLMDEMEVLIKKVELKTRT
ncbi:MAG: oligoendopeptidase F [Bdellovibrionaceae bacterium]|nr:oligoendopeptidase F [Pseudobdellovibrionaceae bacterium]